MGAQISSEINELEYKSESLQSVMWNKFLIVARRANCRMFDVLEPTGYVSVQLLMAGFLMTMS